MRKRRRGQRLSRKVKKRDAFQCQLCRSTKELEAHHLFGQAKFPGLKKDMKNLITLCHQCHQRFHHFRPFAHTGKDFLDFLQHLYKQEGHTNARGLAKRLLPIIKNLEEQVNMTVPQETKNEPKPPRRSKTQQKMNNLLDIDLEARLELKVTLTKSELVIHNYEEEFSLSQLEELKKRWEQSLGA